MLTQYSRANTMNREIMLLPSWLSTGLPSITGPRATFMTEASRMIIRVSGRE